MNPSGCLLHAARNVLRSVPVTVLVIFKITSPYTGAPCCCFFLWLPQHQVFALSVNFLCFLFPAEYYHASTQRIVLVGRVSAGHITARLHWLHGALCVRRCKHSMFLYKFARFVPLELLKYFSLCMPLRMIQGECWRVGQSGWGIRESQWWSLVTILLIPEEVSLATGQSYISDLSKTAIWKFCDPVELYWRRDAFKQLQDSSFLGLSMWKPLLNQLVPSENTTMKSIVMLLLTKSLYW